jgi:hypothetical protein
LRAAGLTLPFADPRRHHGAPLEGWFWRFTWPDGRAAVALCGLCRGWALVSLAVTPSHGSGPARRVRTQTVDAPVASGTSVRAGRALAAEPERLRVDLGPDWRLEAQLRGPARWPRRAWGGLGPAGWLPGLGQYWHPHVLRSGVEGSLVVDGERWDLAGATAYAEKNWGRGFPARWWWGEAHDFGGDDVSVAFAGGPVLPRVEATALVVRLGGRGGGRVLRLGEPLLGPVRATIGPGSWRLTGRTPGHHRVEVEASADPAAAHVLDVPVPGERRTVPWSHHHVGGGALRVRVTRRGRTVYAGETAHAGLELGRAP